MLTFFDRLSLSSKITSFIAVGLTAFSIVLVFWLVLVPKKVLADNTGTFNGFSYSCQAGREPMTGIMPTWINGNYTYSMWQFFVVGTQTPSWSGNNDLYGAEISSEYCNGSGAAGDNVIVSQGGMASPDGRHPIGLWLGAENMGAANNNGLWANPQSVPVRAVLVPPVYQYNYESAAAVVDDSGGFIIGGAGAFAGNHTVWCQSLVTGWDGLVSCPEDISAYPKPASGAGYLMNRSDCNLPGAQCNGSLGNPFSWIKQPGNSEDLANTTIGITPTGQLNDFTAHSDSRNTLDGGWGAITFTQAQYPNVAFSFTATCSTVTYSVTDPLYPTYPAADPSITFTLPDGSTQSESGLSGSFALPPGENGTLTGTVNLDGEPFSPSQNLSCPITVSGTIRVQDPNNPTMVLSGVTVSGVTVRLTLGADCSGATTDTTSDANGNYSFTIPQGTGYCVNVVGIDHRKYDNGLNVYPRIASYKSCAPDLVCAAYSQYDSQYAGVDYGTPDRPVGADAGLDFALVQIQYDCTDINTTVEPNQNYNLNMTFGAIYGSIGSGDTMDYSISISAPSIYNSSPNPITGSWTPPPSTTTYSLPLTSINEPMVLTGTYNVTGSFGGITYFTTRNCAITVNVANKPYFKVYGGDVAVGQGRDTASATNVCKTDNGAGISAYDDNTGRGAGTQLGAQVLGIISGFASAAALPHAAGTGPPPNIWANPPKDLTFSNTTNPVGQFGADPQSCAYDYWSGAPAVPVSGGDAVNVGSIGAGTYHYQAPSPNAFNINSNGNNTISKGVQLVIYVDGDVLIKHDIDYATKGLNNLSDLPSLYLIVNGDIYIDTHVQNLAGVYVATGKIYTCTSGHTLLTSTNLYSSGCGTSNLTVNGAFVAPWVQLLRSGGTLQASPPNPEPSTSGNIAETFNYSPYVWLANSGITTGGNNAGQVDSISSLPPVL